MDAEAVTQMYESGMTATEIAAEIGCSSHRVYTTLERAGIKRRTTGRRRFAPATEAEIAERYRNGETYEQIAKTFGCSTYVVARLAREAGVTPRKGGMKPGHWSEEERRVISQRLRGEKHPKWKGGKITDSLGYVLVKVTEDDELAWSMRRSNNYVREHRLVMARRLSRPLQIHETVHHLNGDRQDNRIENLELRVGGHGKGATHAHCATCTCFEEN